MMTQELSMLRIYMRRGDNKKAKTFWGRFFEKPLSQYLIQEALKFGVLHAFLNTSNVGFVKGAKSVSHDMSEVPPATLPICIELVAPKAKLEGFLNTHSEVLARATTLVVSGVEVRAEA